MELIVVSVGIEGDDIVDKLDKIKGIRKRIEAGQIEDWNWK